MVLKPLRGRKINECDTEFVSIEKASPYAARHRPIIFFSCTWRAARTSVSRDVMGGQCARRTELEVH